MRYMLLPVLCIGLAGPVCAQPPAGETPAGTHAHAPLSPLGAAMANLTRALHDAAQQARHPDAPAGAAPTEPSATHAPDAHTRPPRPQPTAQAALP